jgi:hypothetical protein
MWQDAHSFLYAAGAGLLVTPRLELSLCLLLPPHQEPPSSSSATATCKLPTVSNTSKIALKRKDLADMTSP